MSTTPTVTISTPILVNLLRTVLPFAAVGTDDPARAQVRLEQRNGRLEAIATRARGSIFYRVPVSHRENRLVGGIPTDQVRRILGMLHPSTGHRREWLHSTVRITSELIVDTGDGEMRVLHFHANPGSAVIPGRLDFDVAATIGATFPSESTRNAIPKPGDGEAFGIHPFGISGEQMGWVVDAVGRGNARDLLVQRPGAADEPVVVSRGDNLVMLLVATDETNDSGETTDRGESWRI